MVNSVVADSSKINDGMLYSLPKQLVKVEYTRNGVNVKKAKEIVDELKAKQKIKLEEKGKLKAKVKKLQLDIKNLDTDSEQFIAVRNKYQTEILVLKTQIVGISQSQVALKVKLKNARDNYLKALETGMVFVENFKISPEKPIADNTLTFNANLHHERTRSDSFSLSIKDGLLDGAVASTEDKTGEIFSTIAGGLSGLANFKIPVAAPFTKGNRQISHDVPGIPKCIKQNNIVISQIIDPDDPNDYMILNRKLHAGCLCLVTLSPKISSTAIHKDVEGLVYRSPGTYQFLLREVIKEEFDPMANLTSNPIIDKFRLSLVQGGKVGFITMPKGRFSTNEYDVSFSKGMLVKNDITRPSEYLGAALILPNILREIISIPAELIQLRVNYSTSEKDLIELQQAMVTAQLEIEKRQQELDLLLDSE